MSTTRTLIDAARATSILNSRAAVSMNHVGQQVLLAIQGNATFITRAQQEAKTPGQANYFDKFIYNLKANSTEAMSRPEVKAILKAALIAESEQDFEAADAAFNEYLNAVQLSFNAIAREGVRKFEDGDMVTALIETSETKSGHKAIVVNSVKYKAPTAVAKVKFSLTDLLGEEVAPKEPVGDATGATV